MAHGVFEFNHPSNSARASHTNSQCCLSPSPPSSQSNPILCHPCYYAASLKIAYTVQPGKLVTWISSINNQENHLYNRSNEMFILAESTWRMCFLFFFMFSQHLVLAARNLPHPAWHQGFETFLKWWNVCAGVYFNLLLHGFEQVVFQEAASVLCFLIIIISGRNADKANSLYSKLLFIFFHSWKWSFPILSLVFRMYDACQAFEWCVNYKLLIEHVFI